MRNRSRRLLVGSKLWLIVSMLAALVTVLGSGPVYAGGMVGNGTPGSCTDAAYAAAMAGGGLVSFNCGSAPVTIAVNTQVINPGVTTTVDGGGLVTLDGENLRQLFLVLNGGTLNLRNITLTRGQFGSGGAIFNQAGGTTDLYRVRIENSVAESTVSLSGGGAIHNSGTLHVERSILANNMAKRLGGALWNGGAATVVGSSFIANSATVGGAIWQTLGTLTLDNVSLISNRADPNTPLIPLQGGAIYSFGTITSTNTTFAGNIADKGGALFAATNSINSLLNVTMYANRADTGGAIFNESSNVTTMKNTVVGYSRDRADTSDSLNCDSNGANTSSGGYNVIGDNSCFGVPGPGDQTAVNPMLSPLSDNGGPTLTAMPQVGSPVINNGTNSGCPARDQRGALRPFGPTCDVGSVEYGAHPPSLWLPIVTRN